jgi:hypothetical protein
MGNHRAQLHVGDEGAIVLIEESGNVSLHTTVMLRVEDVNTHCERAIHCGRRPERRGERRANCNVAVAVRGCMFSWTRSREWVILPLPVNFSPRAH